ncbi:PQQ-binding-like beta-propeller repeat protein [bacterium]|nr:PQQ-binding-like beta-propeller repeat protein [bacterium]
MDVDLRELERRVKRDPSDENARLSLGLALFRAGKETEAREAVRPDSREGYSALARAALGEPALGPLLDVAHEWRSSGGDPGCTRWSKALPVTRPRTAWRRRIEGAHAALALSVDRGRAFVLVQAPGKTMELVALSVISGETLWRFPLGKGPAAAPAACNGVVYEAGLARSVETGHLHVTHALTGSSGKKIWDWDFGLRDARLHGAVTLSGNRMFLPISNTSRGSSRAPDPNEHVAFLFAMDTETRGRAWDHICWNVGSEVACFGESVFVPVYEAPLPRGDRLACLAATDGRRLWSANGTSDRNCAASSAVVSAGAGRVTCRELSGAERWSTQGGSETSLCFDGARVLIGRANGFIVRDAERGREISSWQTTESPLPYLPKGTVQAPPCLRSAVCAQDLAYLASPLSPSISAFDVRTGRLAWRHKIEDMLVPEEGPRLRWPTVEAGEADLGPLHLAPLPGMIFGITLSGYAFLIEESPSS